MPLGTKDGMKPSSGSEGVKDSRMPTGKRPQAVRVWLLGGFGVAVGSRTIENSQWRLRKAAVLVLLCFKAIRLTAD